MANIGNSVLNMENRSFHSDQMLKLPSLFTVTLMATEPAFRLAPRSGLRRLRPVRMSSAVGYPGWSTFPTGRVLLVGEGDFSYAAGLLQRDFDETPLKVTATTLDSEEDLPLLFPTSRTTVKIVGFRAP